MNITLIILLILIGIFLFLFIYIEPLLLKHKVKSDNEYGSARFANKKEIKENFKKQEIRKINKVGFPILFDKNLSEVYMDMETPHWVYLGSTGSGKSVTQVIPMCSFISSAKEERSCFITDPKGEIFSKTSDMFKSRGYEVLTIDFREPELSNRINILTPIINEYKLHIENEEFYNKTKTSEFSNKSIYHLAETNRLIKSLAHMLIPDNPHDKDPFWNNSARTLLEGLIAFFLEEYKLKKLTEDQITLTSIRKFQNSSMNNKNFSTFKTYVDQKEYGLKSKDSLTSILNASDQTLKSITAVFGEKMSLFDDVNVANVLSKSDFDFDILGKKKTVIYLIVPDEDKTYYVLITVIVGLMYRELVKNANQRKEKKLKVGIDWLLDEFANCPPLSDIESLVSVARSRNMRFSFFIQSFAQLDNVYGKEVSQIILDNCGLVYLKTNTQETAEAVSKRLGKKTIEQNSVNQSISLLNYNGNRTTSLLGRDVMTPEEIKQLHYKMIIFPIIGFPIIRDTILYDKFSIYKSGAIKRKINNLQDLKNTYYTVEDINSSVMDENKKKYVDKFEVILKRLPNIFDRGEYQTEIKENNNVYYLEIKFIKIDIAKINKHIISNLDQRVYHYTINIKNNTLEIHIKNLMQILINNE